MKPKNENIKRKLTWEMYAHLPKINQIITPWSLECLLNKILFCPLFLAAADDHNDTTQEDKFQCFFHGTFMMKKMYSFYLDSNIASGINVKLTAYCTTQKNKKKSYQNKFTVSEKAGTCIYLKTSDKIE